MASKTLKIKDQIALKENTKYRGSITNVMAPYTSGDPTMYMVQWEGYSLQFMYLPEVLISKEEADALEVDNKKKTEDVKK